MNETLNIPGASITSATGWISNALLGSFATSITVIAIATMGLLLLLGLIDIRRAARLVVGCFIILGASAIAQGILGVFPGGAAGADVAQTSPQPATPPPLVDNA